MFSSTLTSQPEKTRDKKLRKFEDLLKLEEIEDNDKDKKLTAIVGKVMFAMDFE